jgi:hypothetical protein
MTHARQTRFVFMVGALMISGMAISCIVGTRSLETRSAPAHAPVVARPGIAANVDAGASRIEPVVADEDAPGESRADVEPASPADAGPPAFDAAWREPDGEGSERDEGWDGAGSGGACCKTCRRGKACGDSCIARSMTCRKGPGCACDQ